MRKQGLLMLFICLASQYLVAQPAGNSKISAYTYKNSSLILKEFANFVSIPNLASDRVNLDKTTEFMMDMMKKLDIEKVQLFRTATDEAPPVVYGEVNVPGAKKTLIFYAHYDGQPVNPKQWAEGLNPFTPVLYSASLEKGGAAVPFPDNNAFDPEWRLYGRSTSDDKAGVYVILKAYEAIKKSGLTPGCNIKFFFEGEEEAGSPHLNEFLEKYNSLLQSDLWIICDGPVHQSGKKQISFGVRGDTHLDLTVYASKRPLHSGHYGNWAPNPALMLAELLASMKDENGKVTIKGFYDDVIPLSDSEKKALSEVPAVDEQMKKELGISSTEMPGIPLNEAINLPSLNINGFSSGNVGKQASNQIPTYATAVIDLRLVLGNDWERQQQKVIDHIKAQGYFVTNEEPTDEERGQHGKIIRIIAEGGYNAQRTSMDLPIAQKVIEAVKSTTDDQVVLQPSMGGSLPLYLIEKYVNANTISVPVANHDNNQHAENENLRLKNLFDGIETMASLMMMK